MTASILCFPKEHDDAAAWLRDIADSVDGGDVVSFVGCAVLSDGTIVPAYFSGSQLNALGAAHYLCRFVMNDMEDSL